MNCTTATNYINSYSVNNNISDYEIDNKHHIEEYQYIINNFSGTDYDVRSCVDWFYKAQKVFSQKICEDMIKNIAEEMQNNPIACGQAYKWIKNTNFVLFMTFSDRTDNIKIISKISYDYDKDVFVIVRI